MGDHTESFFVARKYVILLELQKQFLFGVSRGLKGYGGEVLGYGCENGFTGVICKPGRVLSEFVWDEISGGWKVGICRILLGIIHKTACVFCAEALLNGQDCGVTMLAFWKRGVVNVYGKCAVCGCCYSDCCYECVAGGGCV